LNPLKAWNTFWFRPISARPLGAFRILLGLLTLAQLTIISFDVDHWMTDAGVLHGDEARLVAGPLRPSPLQWVQDPASVHAFVAVTAVVAGLVTIGWHTRVSSVLLYLMMLSIHHRNILTNCGPDSLLMILIFYLMLCPSGAAYSLDARRISRRRGTPAEPVIVPWPQRLIQVQICMIYFVTAVLKSSGPSWLNGTALHYVFMNVEVRRFDFEWICQYPLVINLLGYGGLISEFSLAFLLWFRPTRGYAALAGVAFHAGVFFVVNVPLFGELMTACYLTFLTPTELDALVHTLNPRNWFRSRQHTPLRIPGRVDGPESPKGTHTALAGVHEVLMKSEEARAN
jgi:hypothetical protein